MRKTRRLARWVRQKVWDQESEEMPEYQRRRMSTVEEAPKWVEEQYRNSELVPDAASYHIHTPPHDFRRQQC